MNIFFYCANGLVLVLTLWLLFDLTRRDPEGMRWLAAAAAPAVSIAAAVLLFLGPDQISTRLITATQEGSGLGNILQLYGQNTHAGPNFRWLTQLQDIPGIRLLRGIARLNIALTLADCVIFFFVAWHILRFLPVVLILGLVYCANVSTRLTALSELPSALLTVYFWTGALAVFAACKITGDGRDAATARSPRLLAAIALLAAGTLLVLLTRFEYAVFGITALSVILARYAWGNARLKDAESRLLASAGQVPRWLGGASWPALIVLFSLFCLFFPMAIDMAADKINPQARWLFSGVYPLDLSFLNMPFFLFTYLPQGIIVLFLLGAAYAMFNWPRFCLLPLPLLILYRVYYNASHLVFFEMVRYMTALTPVVMFLSVLGWKQLEAAALEKGWPPGWRKAALVALGVFTLVPPMNGTGALFGRDPRLKPPPTLDMDLQREVRYLAEITARYPGCVFVSQVTRSGNGEDRGNEFVYAVFGEGLAEPVIIQKRSGDLLAAAKEAAGDPGCVLFYRGLDCALDHGDGCAASAEQGDLIEERTFASRPYNDPKERGGYVPEIHLQLYRIHSCEPPAKTGRPK